MTGAKLLGMHETVPSPKEYRSHPRGSPDDVKRVTSRQRPQLRVGIAWGGPGRCWRETSRGFALPDPNSAATHDWMSAHRTVAGRHPGALASRSACNVPAAGRQGSGTAPVTPRLPQATGNVCLRAIAPARAGVAGGCHHPSLHSDVIPDLIRDPASSSLSYLSAKPLAPGATDNYPNATPPPPSLRPRRKPEEAIQARTSWRPHLRRWIASPFPARDDDD
jgi:hypothetical protein